MKGTMELDEATRVLRSGRLVAFPTETVYGLGGDATNSDAVQRIFAAKGRPSTNPLIVHVSDAAVAQRYAKHWSTTADQLARRFWPGPLTLVVPKADSIVKEVSAGLETVGLRAPDHPLALRLLREFDGPVAAPSANRSNRVSPTTAEHVRRELGGAVDLILDGGACSVGIESTVLDLSQGTPRILRPGGITREEIQSVVGPVDVVSKIADSSQPASSPGQQAVHYSPATTAYRLSPGQWREFSSKPGRTVVPLILGGSREWQGPDRGIRPIIMPAEPKAYARRLYAALREADELGAHAIYVEMPPDEPEWAAVRDRLLRATRPL